MSLKDDLKKVIGPSKEDIDYMEWRKKQPRVTMEQANAQLRASKSFRERYDREHGHVNRPHNGHLGK